MDHSLDIGVDYVEGGKLEKKPSKHGREQLQQLYLHERVLISSRVNTGIYPGHRIDTQPEVRLRRFLVPLFSRPPFC